MTCAYVLHCIMQQRLWRKQAQCKVIDEVLADLVSCVEA
eukprot:SAG11_NODE_10846_length_802_cov_0.951636_1_plen_38_part_10